MGGYLFDFIMVAILIIGLTALLGVITNGIGERLFGGKHRKKFVNQTSKMQTGWNHVGGKKR